MRCAGLDEPRRIVCFHLNQVGDLLFSLPAIHNLRTRYSEATVTSVARPHLRELLRLSGMVDEIIERPRRPIGTGFGVASRLRRGRYDLAVLFSTSLGMSVLAAMTGAPVRVGFDDPVCRPFLTKTAPRVKPPSMQNNLRLLEAIGCPIVKRDYAGLIHPGQGERDQADTVLRSAGLGVGEPYAVLSPGTSGRREVKTWSSDGFARVADEIMREFGIRSVVVGLNNGCNIHDLSANTVDLLGKTSLPVLSAVLEKAVVFVGVDSGVMHLAAAVKTPIVALFGPSDPNLTGPQGEHSRIVSADVPCRPCLLSHCDNGRICMDEITPEAVFSATRSLISETTVIRSTA